ncbi:hypothetical protein J6590_077659 [Homalodisca vitripennis]|nr:hypothetical protein J6590_077659 [Homalodisca vitripennis]
MVSSGVTTVKHSVSNHYRLYRVVTPTVYQHFPLQRQRNKSGYFWTRVFSQRGACSAFTLREEDTGVSLGGQTQSTSRPEESPKREKAHLKQTELK